MSQRAYRITFDHKVSKFVIETQGLLGLVWSASKESGKVRYFETFDAASDHVKAIGLNRVYEDFTFKSPFGTQRAGPTLAELQDVYGSKAKPSVRWLASNEPFPTLNKELA